MEKVDHFICWQNIARYEEMLTSEGLSAAQRVTVEKLLAEERRRLSHPSEKPSPD